MDYKAFHIRTKSVDQKRTTFWIFTIRQHGNHPSMVRACFIRKKDYAVSYGLYYVHGFAIFETVQETIIISQTMLL
jgi:hypothetical protein